jgi:hypothetical protein
MKNGGHFFFGLVARKRHAWYTISYHRSIHIQLQETSEETKSLR